MVTDKPNRFWTLVAIFLAAMIFSGGAVIWFRYSPDQPLEISLPRIQKWQSMVHISGDINNPGFYPVVGGDTIDALIQTAGGTVAGANLSGLELHISGTGRDQPAQRIDLNRAEIWLLEALPGVGETLAQRIVDYRRQNGLFRNTNELLKVAHHGSATSTTADFLAVVNPRLAVISVGEDNSFGHPDIEVMTRLEERLGRENIYRTDEQGTIEFITDGERLWVRDGN